jgi:hypothetical protein
MPGEPKQRVFEGLGSGLVATRAPLTGGGLSATLQGRSTGLGWVLWVRYRYRASRRSHRLVERSSRYGIRIFTPDCWRLEGGNVPTGYEGRFGNRVRRTDGNTSQTDETLWPDDGFALHDGKCVGGANFDAFAATIAQLGVDLYYFHRPNPRQHINKVLTVRCNARAREYGLSLFHSVSNDLPNRPGNGFGSLVAEGTTRAPSLEPTPWALALVAASSQEVDVAASWRHICITFTSRFEGEFSCAELLHRCC